MPEPRDPLLKVVIITLFTDADCNYKKVYGLVLVAGKPAQETTSAQKTWVKKYFSRPRSQGLHILLCNDPSAGSPTETLLRLLLPLNDRV